MGQQRTNPFPQFKTRTIAVNVGLPYFIVSVLALPFNHVENDQRSAVKKDSIFMLGILQFFLGE